MRDDDITLGEVTSNLGLIAERLKKLPDVMAQTYERRDLSAQSLAELARR